MAWKKFREDENKVIPADITVSFKERTVHFSHLKAIEKRDYKGVEHYSVSARFATEGTVHPLVLTQLLRGSGDIPSLFNKTTSAQLESVTFRNIVWGGGTTHILETKEGSFVVAVWRDQKARNMPNKIDTSSGYGNSKQPLFSLLGEGLEEIILMKKGRALLPNLYPTLDPIYDNYFWSVISKMASRFGVNGSVEHSVSFALLKDPFFFAGKKIPMHVTFSPSLENPEVLLFAVAPIVWKLEESIGEINARDTLEIETGGKVPERDVVMIDLESGRTIVSHSGALIAAYRDWASFLSSGIDEKEPFTPDMAVTLQALDRKINQDILKSAKSQSVSLVSAKRD